MFKKALIVLLGLSSVVCHAENLNTKKNIEIDFGKKDCTVVNLTEVRTFVNCNNGKYLITYDKYGEFDRIAIINEKGETKGILFK